MTWLKEQLDRTEKHLLDADYRGYDPYDALESPIFRLPVLATAKHLRWGFQQVLKRVPFNVRPLLGILPGRSPVTLALAIQGLLYRDRALPCSAPGRQAEIVRLMADLESSRSAGYSGSCWGYDFAWEARYASFPKGHPTVVATGFVTNALFQIWRQHGLEAARAMCLDAVPFVLKDLNRSADGDTFCWSYSPTDTQIVLNATMNGARLLAQAVHMGADPACLAAARATVRYVVGRQSPGGSWPYSVGDPRSWVDNFHTCYILDCLDEYQSLTGDTTFAEQLQRGVDYYVDNFFTDEGIPKYYDKSVFPIDATCCGQALLTLVRFGRIEMAASTAGWVVNNLALPDGSFKYQLHRRWENRLPYTRWSTCWVFAGLAALDEAME